MVTVKVDQLRLHAFHGIYNGEPLVGGDFEINVEVDYNEENKVFDKLDDTISYVALIDIVTTRMKSPTQLLEKVARLISVDIKETFPDITASRVSISKLQAPIAQFQGRVGVVLNRQY
jgi:7,8-dihydroneopterin aldolase/epimerase/oxygenase